MTVDGEDDGGLPDDLLEPDDAGDSFVDDHDAEDDDGIKMDEHFGLTPPG